MSLWFSREIREWIDGNLQILRKIPDLPQKNRENVCLAIGNTGPICVLASVCFYFAQFVLKPTFIFIFSVFVSCYYRVASPLMTEKLCDNKFSGLQTFWCVGVPRHIKIYFRVPSVEERLGNTDLDPVKKQFCIL